MKSELETLVESIIEHLEGWEVAATQGDASRRAAIRDREGREVVLAYSYTHKGRVVVHGNWKWHDGYWFKPDDAELASITVDPKRDPIALARDIDRRYLSKFAAVWDEQMERLNGWVKHERDTEAVLKEIEALLSPHCCRPLGKDRVYGGGLEVRVNGPDSIEIQVRSMSTEAAKQVLALIKETDFFTK